MSSGGEREREGGGGRGEGEGEREKRWGNTNNLVGDPQGWPLSSIPSQQKDRTKIKINSPTQTEIIIVNNTTMCTHMAQTGTKVHVHVCKFSIHLCMTQIDNSPLYKCTRLS